MFLISWLILQNSTQELKNSHLRSQLPTGNQEVIIEKQLIAKILTPVFSDTAIGPVFFQYISILFANEELAGPYTTTVQCATLYLKSTVF